MEEAFLRRTFTAVLFLLTAAVAIAQQAGVIKEVIVRGNVNISEDAIKSSMRAAPGKPFIQADLLQDEQSVRDLGFFQDVKILSRAVSDTEWQVIVEVQENPVIKEIRITGNTVIANKKLEALIQQQVDQVFNLRLVGPTADAIANLYQKEGYFAQADIQPLKESPGTLNVQIIERAVNEIVITGLTRTRQGVMRRLLRTKPGKAFNENLWAIDRRRLESTQWFENIEAGSQPTTEIGKFDLLLDVKEARTGQINFGFALDPRSRLAGTFGYSDSNFRGTGQSVGANFQQDTVGTGLSATLDYLNPFFDNRETTLAVRVYSRVNSYFAGITGSTSPTADRFDERRTGGSIAVSRPFKEIYSTTVGISAEDIKTLNFRTTGATNYIQQDGRLITLNLQVARDTRDVPLDPQQGDYSRILLEPANANINRIGGNVAGFTNVLGNHNFLRTTVEYKRFWSRTPKDPRRLLDPRPVIAFRARAGIIKGVVPFFEQFFLGGSDSLRGYSDQRFWGKRMFLASAEYRHPIQKSFNIIPFIDYGGAWGGYGTINNFNQSSSPNLKLGYGVGVGFKTPLGAIRIDFGFNQEGQSRTSFSIGGSF